jgi:uncharacterized membrane protein YphA (DoxX/SURF4 family)
VVKLDSFVYGLGAVLLGLVGLYFGEFALQWQPVPASLPLRTPLAYASAGLLLLTGLLVLSGRATRFTVALLAAFYAVWVFALHGPLVAAQPKAVYLWLGIAEIAALMAGGVVLFATTGGGPGRTAMLVLSRIVFGLSAIVFGYSHYEYVKETAAFMPAFFPEKIWLAYGTGVCHALAGIAILAGVKHKLAATMLAIMMGSFVVLVHAFRIYATPTVHSEWVALGIATALTGSALLMRRA